MTKISVFGEDQEKADKTPIELVLWVEPDGTIGKFHGSPSIMGWDNVMLLNNGAAHGKEYDTIVVWNDTGDRQKYTYLGYWNDGVE